MNYLLERSLMFEKLLLFSLGRHNLGLKQFRSSATGNSQGATVVGSLITVSFNKYSIRNSIYNISSKQQKRIITRNAGNYKRNKYN